jgi:hypothetical protein
MAATSLYNYRKLVWLLFPSPDLHFTPKRDGGMGLDINVSFEELTSDTVLPYRRERERVRETDKQRQDRERDRQRQEIERDRQINRQRETTEIVKKNH